MNTLTISFLFEGVFTSLLVPTSRVNCVICFWDFNNTSSTLLYKFVDFPHCSCYNALIKY